MKSNLKFVAGKRVADFGCGKGDFLRLVKPYCDLAVGVELQTNYVAELNASGIKCVSDLSDIEDGSLDVIVSFHVLEHLPDPISTLTQLKRKGVSGGHI